MPFERDIHNKASTPSTTYLHRTVLRGGDRKGGKRTSEEIV